MLGVAQDVRGAETVAPVVAERRAEFPVLLDPKSTLGNALGFRSVPSGFFVDDEGTLRYRRVDDFDLGDPRDRSNLAAFLEGRGLECVDEGEQMDPRALKLFAEGVAVYTEDDVEEALALWRSALEFDPDNFVIRSQIWAVQHPEHFWPVVDRDWQQLQLLKEGYGKPLP